MAFSNLGNEFVWFVARVVDIKDPEQLGRMKIRVIHGQTGELGKTIDSFGVEDKDLLWAYPISSIQSASLHWKKVADNSHPLEGFGTPSWIGAVGLSPTGIAVGTYVYGFYLDGREQNIPMVFGTYHKKSIHPEPPSQSKTNRMLQLKGPTPPPPPEYLNDIAPLARGTDDEGNGGQTLPKEPYAEGARVKEPPSSYKTTYPYNTTYTTKSGHAIELDDSPGHERIHVWHNSGSYEEISNGLPETSMSLSDPPESDQGYRGRRVKKTVHDDFEIVLRDKGVLISRNKVEEVGKDLEVFIGKDGTIEIGENAKIEIGKDGELVIGDNANMTVGKSANVKIGRDSNVSIGGDSRVSVSGDTKLSIRGKLSVSARSMNFFSQSTISMGARQRISLSAPIVSV